MVNFKIDIENLHKVNLVPIVLQMKDEELLLLKIVMDERGEKKLSDYFKRLINIDIKYSNIIENLEELRKKYDMTNENIVDLLDNILYDLSKADVWKGGNNDEERTQRN